MYNFGYTDEYNSSNSSAARRTEIMEIENETYEIPSTTRQRIVQTIADFVIIVAIFVIFIFVYLFQDPKIRYFTCDQSDIFFPYIKDTIPFWAVGIYGALGPIIIILFVEILNARFLNCGQKPRKPFRIFFVCLFHAISLFLLGAAIVVLLTEIGKRWVGRLRPHFISVCKPDYTKFNCVSNGLTGTVYNPIYTGGNFCTGDSKEVKEARFSFPSGHSSFSWYTMLFTIIYLEARFIVIRLRYVKTLLQVVCFIAAFVTMLSRVSDYHHRGSDVLGGTVLGCIVAISITLYVGRVLWVYEKKLDYVDFDLKDKRKIIGEF